MKPWKLSERHTRDLWWSHRLPNTRQANHLGRVLLKTMQQDCHQFVRKCVKCQMHAPSIHAPAPYLQSVSLLGPFRCGPSTWSAPSPLQLLMVTDTSSRLQNTSQMGRSCNPANSRRPACGFVYSQESSLSLWHPTWYCVWQWQPLQE